MVKTYGVTWTDDERAPWLTMTKRGKVAARQVNRAHVLLHAHTGAPDEVIAPALHLGPATVERTRKRFVEEGLAAALAERPRPGGRRKLVGKPEAFLIALACSAPPDERLCSTMPRRADTRVDLDIVASSSDETVRRTLKKPGSSRGRNRHGVFPR